jgi:very-long-chain enoyl-CoA reductase
MGILLFFIGELGNLYHHWLLRKLRSGETAGNHGTQKKHYVPPTGGLFRFVATPHYFFEVVAFLGIALSSQSIHTLLIALGMGSYLSGRAVLTRRFYHKTFSKKEWSRDKKAIIPFVF